MAPHLVSGPLSGPAPPKYRGRNPFWRFRRLFFLLAVVAGVGLAIVWNLASQVELTADDTEDLIVTSYVCTAEVEVGCNADNATNEISLDGEDRVEIPYDEIPEVLVQAIVSTEDKNYWDHNGVDPVGLARAGYQGFRNKFLGGSGSVQGGSTITQQYIKLSSGDDQVDLARKGREIVRAIKLEQGLTEQFQAEIDAEYGDNPPEGVSAKQMAKEEILERYLNRVWFERRSYGVQAAARNYYGKDVGDLTLPEAAYLAGLIRNPTAGEYSSHPEEAARRREVTLVLMAENGYITPEQRDNAIADPWASITDGATSLGIGSVKGSEYGTDYFIVTVRKRLKEIFPEESYYRSGIRVYTTLDPSKQQAAWETITGRLDPSNELMPLGALVTLDDQGRVVSMMGGADWNGTANNRYPQVNLATGRDGGGVGFQPGSTMKPIVLAEFIRQGYSPLSYVLRTSVEINGHEWDGNDSAQPPWVTVEDATTYSMNTPYLRLGQEVGTDNVAILGSDLGITSPLEAIDSLPLGTEEVGPLEMATVFSTFANEGVRKDPVVIDRIEDVDGNVLCWYPVAGTDCSGSNPEANADRSGEQVLEGSVARQINYELSKVVSSGTGKRANLVADDGTWRATAGKTGTTDDYKDAWFNGFTCGYTTAVWMGYPNADDNYPFRDGVEMTPEAYEEMRAGLSEGEKEQEQNKLGWHMSNAAEPRSADLFGSDYPKIEGGTIPAEMWHDYMLSITAGDEPCDSLPTEAPDPNLTILGRDLTTTTLPDCVPVAAPNGGGDNGGGDPAAGGDGSTTDTGGGGDESAFGLLGGYSSGYYSSGFYSSGANHASILGAGRLGSVVETQGNGNGRGRGRRNGNNEQAQGDGQGQGQGQGQDGGGGGQTPTTEPCVPVGGGGGGGNDGGGEVDTTDTTDPAAPSTSDPNASTTETVDGGGGDGGGGGGGDSTTTTATETTPSVTDGGGQGSSSTTAPPPPGNGNGNGNGNGRGGGGAGG